MKSGDHSAYLIGLMWGSKRNVVWNYFRTQKVLTTNQDERNTREESLLLVRQIYSSPTHTQWALIYKILWGKERVSCISYLELL